MKYLVVDCETRPDKNLIDLFSENIKAPKNLKDPERIKLAIEKKKEESVKAMSVDTDFADIFCIGVKEMKKNGETGKGKVMNIDEFADLINKEDYVYLITFNGSKFDIPLIIKNGIKKGVKMPYKALKESTNRFSRGNIQNIDLMEILGEYGKYKSLDTYLQIYLGIKKKEIDFVTCTDDELREHCIEDIENTAKLYNLFKELI